MKEIYSLQEVSLRYGNQRILEGLSFAIAEGEFLGLLGPNGCGKTTLLNLLVGVLRPSQGSIQLYQKDLKNYSRREVARLVSVLPQETLVDFPFSALEVVLMGRSPFLKRFQWENAEDLRIAEEAMQKTDCWQFRNRDVRSLSGGERERVLLARALAQEPKVLLLDEPTTHLDLKHQSGIYRLLQRLHREQGLTILAVLHDLNFAANACARILLLAEGKLQAEGGPDQALRAETLQQVFGTRVERRVDLETGRPYFLPELE